MLLWFYMNVSGFVSEPWSPILPTRNPHGRSSKPSFKPLDHQGWGEQRDPELGPAGQLVVQRLLDPVQTHWGRRDQCPTCLDTCQKCSSKRVDFCSQRSNTRYTKYFKSDLLWEEFKLVHRHQKLCANLNSYIFCFTLPHSRQTKYIVFKLIYVTSFLLGCQIFHVLTLTRCQKMQIFKYFDINCFMHCVPCYMSHWNHYHSNLQLKTLEHQPARGSCFFISVILMLIQIFI